MWDFGRLERNVKAAAQLDRHSKRIFREICVFFNAMSAPAADVERVNLPVSADRILQPASAILPNPIGIPGSFADAMKVVLSALSAAISPIAAHYSFLSTIPAAVESIEVTRSSRCAASIKDAENAICTLANLDRLLNSLYERSDGLTQKFENYTGEMTERLVQNPTATRAFRKEFEAVVKARAETAKTRAPIRSQAQLSINTYRQAVSSVRESFVARNVALRIVFDAVQSSMSRISGRLRESAAAVARANDTFNFVNDFTAFVSETKIVRYDMPDLEFKPFEPKVTEIQWPKAEVSITPVYPMGLAKCVADYYASGANQLSCKVGKSLFLMEPTDSDWVLVLNPITLMSGWVPSYCLEVIGRGLGVILKEQPNVSVGDCVAILDDSQLANFVVETAFGQQITVSKGAVGIIHS